MCGDEPDTLYEAMLSANEAAIPLTNAQMNEVLRQTVEGIDTEGTGIDGTQHLKPVKRLKSR